MVSHLQPPCAFISWCSVKHKYNFTIYSELFINFASFRLHTEVLSLSNYHSRNGHGFCESTVPEMVVVLCKNTT